MGIPEKIKAIQDEMARTQINKATEHHIGLLKAISKNYKTTYPPSKRFLNKISKIHSGYRTVFTWYMWRSIDPIDVEY